MQRQNKNMERYKMELQDYLSEKYNKKIEDCSNAELYVALLNLTKEMAVEKVSNEGKSCIIFPLNF